MTATPAIGISRVAANHVLGRKLAVPNGIARAWAHFRRVDRTAVYRGGFGAGLRQSAGKEEGPQNGNAADIASR
jgi:hypothetical protein